MAYKIVFFAFFDFSSSPQAVTNIKKAQTAINRNPNAASIWSKFTIGAKIFIQKSHPKLLPIISLSLLNIRVFHTEKAICITNIPTEVHIMLFLHFLTFSSSLDEKRSFSTPTIRNNIATPIKKFFIWKAIVVKAQSIPSEPLPESLKKKLRNGPIKLFSSSLEWPLSLIFTSLTLLSVFHAADRLPRDKNSENNTKIIRINIIRKDNLFQYIETM